MAVALYQRLGADRLVAESNFGGEMVEALVRGDRNVSYRAVTASWGKVVRAKPVGALYEQGRVSHVGPQRGPGARALPVSGEQG